MRWRLWWALLILAVLPLGGCAQLNEWLEGTAGEETEEEAEDPEQVLKDAIAALGGDVAADRKAAIGKLTGLKRDDALQVVIDHIDDADPAVAAEVLSQLQTLTGFPEKTEDERQLDPEGYQQQLDFKQQILEQGLPKLAQAVGGEQTDVRYGALIVLYNLSQPPVVPEGAEEQLRTQTANAVTQVVLSDTAAEDARILGIETLVAIGAADSVAQLAPLLDRGDDTLRGRVALALGQVAPQLGDAKATISDHLARVAADTGDNEDVRWRALLALGRVGTDEMQGLQTEFTAPEVDEGADISELETTSPLQAYRAYALANATTPEAAQELATLSQNMDQMATTAEEQLAEERKKGYR